MAGAVAERGIELGLKNFIQSHPEIVMQVGVILTVGSVVVGSQIIQELNTSSDELATNVPQLTGRLVRLNARHEIPPEERSPEMIRAILMGNAPSNQEQMLAQWRARMGIVSEESIQIIKPEDPERPFTVQIPKGKEVFITNLPEESLSATVSRESIIPEGAVLDVDAIYIINGKKYGLVGSTTCRGYPSGDDRCGVTPFFFNADFFNIDGIPIYEGLPSAPASNSTVVYPQTKMAIRAGFYGRQLPRSEPPPRAIRSGYTTISPGPKSSFWAAKGIR